VTRLLKTAEIRYWQILDLAPAVIYVKDRNGRYTFINRHFESLSGFTLEQVRGKTDFELFPKEVARNAHANDQKVFASGIPLEIEEFGPVGDEMHTFISAKFPIYDADGNVTELCGISTDITERKASERALRESEARFRAALEANPDPMVLCDTHRRIRYCNPAFSQIFGWCLEACQGRKLETFIPESDRPAFAGRLHALVDEGHMPLTETHYLAKDHHLLTVVVSGGGYRNDAGEPAGCILNIRDVSEQKRLQREIQQAQRLESLGTLAGGIAHNFNNLLMCIQGSVDLIKMAGPGGEAQHENLNLITQFVQYGAELTQQLLGMARAGKNVLEALHVNDIIRSSIAEFSRAAPAIHVRWDLEQGIWEIRADRAQIRLVFAGLFVHAGQVMPQGGDLFISSENVFLEGGEASRYHLKPGRFVKIGVRDTAGGLDPKTQEHIFDPFFTTFFMDKGQGLGLATAYGIVRNHGGIITVDSVQGTGTTFSIFIPAVAE